MIFWRQSFGNIIEVWRIANNKIQKNKDQRVGRGFWDWNEIKQTNSSNFMTALLLKKKNGKGEYQKLKLKQVKMDTIFKKQSKKSRNFLKFVIYVVIPCLEKQKKNNLEWLPLCTMNIYLEVLELLYYSNKKYTIILYFTVNMTISYKKNQI